MLNDKLTKEEMAEMAALAEKKHRTPEETERYRTLLKILFSGLYMGSPDS